ncbi:MAG: shikimate kinase [Clostridia bacterium]|nr:shikimate kinase [Clostridia bacterium]
MDNIILIGMPGSGKSTVGVILAKLLGYSFIDADLLIQQREGKKLYEILRDDGPDYFAKVENEVNASIDTHKTVIATGGSVVYGKEAMAHFKEIGTVVYLQVTLSELLRRLGNYATRGILMKEGETFTDLYNQRVPLYEQYADVTFSGTAADLITNAESLAARLSENKE